MSLGRTLCTKPRAAMFAALALMLTGCTTLPEKTGTRWHRIFDDRSLNGWTAKISGYAAGQDPLNTFRVADGIIHVGYEGYDGHFRGRFGHLFYNTSLKSYRLKLKYRIVGTPIAGTPSYAEYNSGVMIHAQSPTTMLLNQGFPVSAEAQILGPRGTEKRTNGNVCTPGTNITIAGKLTRIHCINSSVPAPPNDTWREMEIEVSPSGHIIQRVDGVTAIEYDRIEYDPSDKLATKLIAAAGGSLEIGGGYIALQSEGQPIEFKDIEIAETR
jgi:hypothetical protein